MWECNFRKDLHLVQYSRIIILKFLITIKQGDLHFYFALGFANNVGGPARRHLSYKYFHGVYQALH